MKVFSVNGLTRSGKTTTVENVINELRVRGYSVGSVKEIHYEEFKIDVEGTNTYRHRDAGSQMVTARGVYETDVLYQQKLPMDDILSFYHHDYVVLEGVNDINAPIIITAHNTQEIEAKLDYRTMAISGVIADRLDEYKGLPVIHCIKDTARLVDMIEEKVPDMMPDFDPKCCRACGMDCQTMLGKILSGEKKREDCVISQTDIHLKVEGKTIDMVPFVQNILRNAVVGVVSELTGYKPGAKIEITIGQADNTKAE